MSESTTILVNGQPVMLGCYIEGHHGIYAPDVLERILTNLALPVSNKDCPTYWRDLAENGQPELWDAFYESADSLLYMLNSFTQDGFIWDWVDGELFLTELEEIV